MAWFKKKTKKEEDSSADVSLGEMGALTDAKKSGPSKKKETVTLSFEEEIIKPEEAPPQEEEIIQPTEQAEPDVELSEPVAEPEDDIDFSELDGPGIEEELVELHTQVVHEDNGIENGFDIDDILPPELLVIEELEYMEEEEEEEVVEEAAAEDGSQPETEQQKLGFMAARKFMGDKRKQLDDRDRKSTRLNSSHIPLSRMPSSA